MRIAVVTPYYKESDAVLRRCAESVVRQTYDATHFVVADGFPRADVFADFGVRHSSLPFPHRDFGNTPRTVGALSALNQGFDAVAMLDADNWFEPNHIESMVSALESSKAHVACSYRNFYLPDGTFVDFEDPEDALHQHVDTSSFLIAKEAAFLVPVWGMMDIHVAPLCDRVVFWTLQSLEVPVVWTGLKTMNFTANYSMYYLAAGKVPPLDVHDIDFAAMLEKFDARNHFSRTRMRAQFTNREPSSA